MSCQQICVVSKFNFSRDPSFIVYSSEESEVMTTPDYPVDLWAQMPYRRWISTSFTLFTPIFIYGGFLKWWYPKTIGFPTQNDHFGVFWGYHHLRKHPSYIHIYPGHRDICKQELIIFLYLYDFDGISRLILFQLGMSSSQYVFYTSTSW